MDPKPLRYAVLGAGSFGTVLANIICENGYQCSLWMRDEGEAREVQSSRINMRYLPNLQLPDGLYIDSRLHKLAEESDVFIFTVPSAGVREVARVVAQHIKPGALLVSGTKGIEPGSSKLMSQVLEEEIPGHEIGVLSGPNLAKEIAEKQLTGTVIASHSNELCLLIQKVMGNSYFRIYSNEDRTGVELAGTLKNIYAILSGIATGMGFGANSMAMLLTRSLTEMSRYASAHGANAASYLGLSGVGDLFATCTSPLSRNFQIGLRVGKGMNLDEAFKDLGQTAEGVNTVAVVHERAAELDISMPLCHGLYEILHANRPVKEVISSLMDRDQKQDVEFKVN